MIALLRKVRKSMLGTGNARKYLLYAIGEIALVVIGILIALQINNWNEEAKRQQKERDLLLQLKNNLEYNVEQLNAADAEFKLKGQSIEVVVHHMKKKLPYDDSLKYHFYGTFSPGIADLTSSSYETFKSVGLDLIGSDQLREDIINLYEITYPKLEVSFREVLNNWEQGMIVPYYTDHFSFDPSGMIPNNYDLLLNDQKFLNILTGRATLFNFIRILMEDLKEKSFSLIEQLNEFLRKAH